MVHAAAFGVRDRHCACLVNCVYMQGISGQSLGKRCRHSAGVGRRNRALDFAFVYPGIGRCFGRHRAHFVDMWFSRSATSGRCGSGSTRPGVTRSPRPSSSIADRPPNTRSGSANPESSPLETSEPAIAQERPGSRPSGARRRCSANNLHVYSNSAAHFTHRRSAVNAGLDRLRARARHTRSAKLRPEREQCLRPVDRPGGGVPSR